MPGVPLTIAGLIADHARDRPESAFLEDARSTRVMSYGDLQSVVDAWHRTFRELELPPSAAVLIDVDDPLGVAVLQLAAISAGLRVTTVDGGRSASEVARISGLIRGAALLVSDRGADRVAAGAARVDIATDGHPLGVTASPTPPQVSEPHGRGSSVLFTSGSTGTPKGVELLEDQLLFVARQVVDTHGITPNDRGFNPLPLSHVNPQVVGVLSTLVAGSTLVLDQRFRRTGFWELLHERRITWINAVPAILAVLARTGELDPPETLRFVRCASAPLPDHVRAAFAGRPVILSWGMTEAASQITSTAPIDAAVASGVGRPRGSEVQVRRPDGSTAESGEPGELFLRGPGVISRYLFDAAPERFDADGWLATGDLGAIESDGSITLAGRSDDVINRGGEKVYPGEVEEVLLGDPRVLEAVVVGRPDAILGTVPVAYVIGVAPDAVDEEDLISDLTARCVEQLVAFRRPVHITVVADLPRAPAGKVRRSEVRQLAADSAPA
jgi:acyl-CoA synthetase (AMP-forming)/AMP-acid ligase II